jgi:mycothione reductase
LSQLDDNIQEIFSKEFCKRHLVTTNAVITLVSYNQSDGFTVDYSVNGIEYQKQAECLLVATGVTPNTDSLNLSSTGITTDNLGNIIVDSNLQTNVNGVYAFGDVIGRNLFKHTANFEGEWLFERLYRSCSNPLVYPPIPWAVFTNPQVAGAGMNERQALETFGNIVVGECEYADVAMGGAMLDIYGLVKLIFSLDRKLIGACIIGKEASTLIHILIVFMRFNGTVDDIKNLMFVHPALPEVVRGAARNAFQNFLNRSD